MKNRLLGCVMLIILSLSLTACQKTADTDIYSSTVAALANDEAWEFVDIGAEYSVMLVSNALIEDGRTNSMSALCDVYYVVDEQVTRIGSISSESAEYPIRTDETGIYAASEDDVWKYGINDRMSVLELMEQGTSLMEKYEKAALVLFGYGASGR